MPEPIPRTTPVDLAQRVLAAADAARPGLVAQLGRATRTVDDVGTVTEVFLRGGAAGVRGLLEWLPLVRGPLPDRILERAASLLGDTAIPLPIRVPAAARLLRALPDRTEYVKPVARAITEGLPALAALEHLRQLQHQVEKSRSLDTLIEEREQRVKMDCPRCRLRLPRIEMVKHLWHAHGLFLEQGKVRDPAAIAAAIRDEKADGRDPAAVDRAVLFASPEETAFLREWTATTVTPAVDLAPIREAAAEHGAGLCPGCHAEVPAVALELPAPLPLSHGRLAGDGYIVEASGGGWATTVTITTPGKRGKSSTETRRTLTPRGAASVRAMWFLLLGAAAAGGLPRYVPPFLVACLFAMFAVIAYGVVINGRKPPRKRDERAIDAAWKSLARKLLDKPAGHRTLTRLCRASIGRGRPGERAPTLDRIVQKVGTDSDTGLQLLAAAHILRMDDEADARLDRAAKVAALAAAGFTGELPVPYAEYVVAAFEDLHPTSAEHDRLRIHLIAAAFEARLRPRDIRDLWAVAPALGRIMTVEPAHRLGLLAGLWTLRTTRAWKRIAHAETVFELCQAAPNVAGPVLDRFPDLLLYARPDPDTERELGPVLVCGRGIVVGGVLAANPDSEVRVTKAARSGFELIFGRHRLQLTRRPPEEFLTAVRGWLRFRSDVLLPYIDGYLAPGPAEVSRRVREPFRQTCPRCGLTSSVGLGMVGVAPGR